MGLIKYSQKGASVILRALKCASNFQQTRSKLNKFYKCGKPDKMQHDLFKQAKAN